MTPPPPAKRPRRWIWHPFAFALSPIVALYAANADLVAVADIGRSAALALAGAGILWALLAALARSAKKAALLASVSLFAFFFWGHFVHQFISSAQVFNKTPYFIAYFSFFLLLDFALLFLRSRRAPTRFFHVCGGLLLAFPLLSLALRGLAAGPANSAGRTANGAAEWAAADAADFPRRDVFVLLLDGYPRADVLRDDYFFDNTPFLDALRARGFHVVENSHANYPKTLWSLGATLNGAHLRDLIEMDDPDSRDLRPLLGLVKNNRVFRFFARHGFSLYAFETGFDVAEMRGSVHHFLSPRSWGNEFDSLVLQLTPIPALAQRISGNALLFDRHRKRVRFTFNTLKAMPAHPAETPRFVWAHVILPHDPIVFGAGGEPRQIQERFVWGDAPPAHLPWPAYAAQYAAQLGYLNGLVLEALDSILHNTRPEPLIVVFSDHGPHNLLHKNCGSHFKNLCAIHVPAEIPWTPVDHLDLVNLFPFLLNALGASEQPIPLAEESRRYLADWDRPYRLNPCESP